VFAVALLAEFVVTALLFGGDAPLRIYVQAFLVLLVLVIFLLRGSRIAWTLCVLGDGAVIISVLSRGKWGWGIFYAALLLALLTPEARRYIWRQRT
jgi:hypothetical protein